MVTAVFTDNDDCARTYGLWQWDYGQQLRIEGLHLPTAVEIHFALQETGGEAITRVGTTKDGITTVTIPDSMLEGNSAAWTAEKTYNIYAWVYLSDKLSGETIKRITMQVKSRPKPEAFEAPGDGEIFREAIEAVNDAAKRAEEAGDKAAAAADDARGAAAQTAKHLEAVQGLAEQVETNADTVAQDKQTVTGMLSQAQQAASDAALSAQAAKLSETAAVQAQTGAEAAEDTARQYAEETEADRQAVANDKQAVTQMREAVAADRQAVEQTAAQFGQTAQDALTAIGQAQSTAVGAVEVEGQKQTTAVQEAGTQAVSEVTEAKTTAVQAVTTEGDKQTKRVEDAAAGIIADREQISQNKTDIASLVEGMTDLAPAIHSTASGSVITANDAAEGRPFRRLRVFGKSTQDGAPSVENPVPIVSAGESGTINVSISDSGSQSQSLTLATPNGLPGVPVSKDGNYTDADGQQWVCDEIDLERGKYVQRIETRILDGTEAWKHRITNSGNNNLQLLINDRPSSTIHRSFCNYLPYKNFIWDDNIVNLPKIYSYDLEITASFPPESEFKSVEIWNSWLKEKGDFKFQYVLATPIERDLTPEEITAYKALHTNYPTTVISNDAGAHMEVAYVADTRNYIQNLEQRLSAKLVNIQSALISQKISGGGGV